MLYRVAAIRGLALALVSGLVLVGCYSEPEKAAEEVAATTDAATPEPLEDPGPEEAAEVEAFVVQWVADAAGEGGVYGIPPRGEHAVSGMLAGFHTVHRKDADTYSVCVDFKDGENVYDVDFLVDRTTEGLSVSDHYLHKINGEAVE